MQGFNVLHPMGWDAFGLPAENYAIKTGIHPSVTTEKAIANFKRQINSIGFAYDWDREINTTDPQYYKWTQWIFLQLYKKGLAYQGVMPINWCPSCKTGLANEEVTQGKCERCLTQVERKDLRQWILRITSYADRLLEDLSEVDWPESTLLMQKNWIGRSEGAEVDFTVADGPAAGEKIRVFTTRPDTLLVLHIWCFLLNILWSPESLLLSRTRRFSNIRKWRVRKVIWNAQNFPKKTGEFTGACNKPGEWTKIPIWIADYVLASMEPVRSWQFLHDQRDYDFAVKYNLPIIQVVKPADNSEVPQGVAYCESGIAVNSGELNGLPTVEAKKKICKILEDRGQGKAAVSYRLRDWIFSRQRYWGEPIPIVHCKKCGPVPVPEDQLPVTLPEVDRYEPSGTGESPLATIQEWLNTSCPSCGGPALRETNTMPQWAGSCWYYLRYLDPKNNDQPWSQEVQKQWMNVDLYIGGAEHAVLHILYSRFWHKVLYDLGYVSTKEPFKKLRHQGTVLSATYQDSNGRYHEISEVEFRDNKPYLKSTGELLKLR